MEHKGHFRSQDGLDLFERRWMPDTDTKTNLILLHGYGEHCSRYGYVASQLNEAGIAVLSFDQRGFGQSPGKRGYIRRFDVLLRDVDDYLAHIRPRIEGRPWFIMGHSMGGLLLTRYVETRTVDAAGIVLTDPLLAFSDDVPGFLFPLAQLLGALTPWLPVSSVNNSFLARDPKVVAAADTDPLGFHGRVVARSGAEMYTAVNRAYAAFEAITLPIYIIHGSDDRIVPPKGSKLLYEQCRSTDKTFTLHEGGYHEIWNDLDKDIVIAGIRDWIIARI
jgi:acylglycerol lipase